MKDTCSRNEASNKKGRHTELSKRTVFCLMQIGKERKHMYMYYMYKNSKHIGQRISTSNLIYNRIKIIMIIITII